MAAVNFRLKGIRNPTPIYIRFRHGNDFNIWKKSGKVINPKNWTVDKKRKYNGITPKLIKNDPELRNLNLSLEKLSIYIIEEFNKTNPNQIDGEWLEKQIDIFNGVHEEGEAELNEGLLNAVNKLIDNAHTRENSKGGLGLSKSHHRQIRKVTKTKGAFTNNMSLLKLVYLATRNIEKKWTVPLHNWSLTIQQFYIKFGDRIPLAINANSPGASPRGIETSDRV